MNLFINGEYNNVANYESVDNFRDVQIKLVTHKHPYNNKIIRIENIAFGSYDLEDCDLEDVLYWLEEKVNENRWNLSDITFHVYTKGFFKSRKMKRIIKRNGWNLAED